MSIPVWDLKSQFSAVQEKDVFDTLVAESLLAQGRYPLKEMDTYQRYGVGTLEDLAHKQQIFLEQQPTLLALFRDVEMPLVPVLWRMEHMGIGVQKEKLQAMGTELEKEIAMISIDLTRQSDAPINLSSPAQIGAFLVAKFGVPLKKTATGQYATGEQELLTYAPLYPIITQILKYRELMKLKSTYVDGLLSKIGPDGRIHTTYNQTASITGRLSSSSPNLQNIPVSTETGVNIKSAFVPSPGYTLVAFDYSQQELRILAHLTQEKNLIEAFAKNQDIHTVSAAKLFHVPYEDVNREQRAIAKMINFGIVYGMGSFGLAQTLRIPVEDAQAFINNFYETFPSIKQYFDRLLKDGLKDNSIETILGRRRYVYLSEKKKFIDNATRRELINYPIQGSAADLIKKAMVQLDRELLDGRDDIRMLLQIHDELIFEIADKNQSHVDSSIAQVRAILQHVHPLVVPMQVDVKRGKAWGAMTTI